MQSFILAKQPEIIDLCRTHHVRRLSIFGSAVATTSTPPPATSTFVSSLPKKPLNDPLRSYFDLHDQLTALFGRKVDIISSSKIEILSSRDHRKRASDSLCCVISKSICGTCKGPLPRQFPASKSKSMIGSSIWTQSLSHEEQTILALLPLLARRLHRPRHSPRSLPARSLRLDPAPRRGRRSHSRSSSHLVLRSPLLVSGARSLLSLSPRFQPSKPFRSRANQCSLLR